MPDKSIENRLKYAVLMSPGEPVIKAFAEMFAVSTEAMRIRFKTFKQEFPDLTAKLIFPKYNLHEVVRKSKNYNKTNVNIRGSTFLRRGAKLMLRAIAF